MLTWLENKSLATKRGLGQVLRENQSLVKVLYDLNIFQVIRIYKTLEYREEFEGPITIQGEITVLDKFGSLENESNLVLQMENGRRIAIDTFTLMDCLNNRYNIQIQDAFAWE